MHGEVNFTGKRGLASETNMAPDSFSWNEFCPEPSLLPMSHTPHPEGESLILGFLRGMGPSEAPDGAPHCGPSDKDAVMCSIMVLNSVIEREGNRMLEEHNLTLPQWLALGCVASGGADGVPHSAIGSRLMLSKAPVTGVVDRLEKAGLVERHPDLHDRRVSRVVITDAGTAMWWRVEGAFALFSGELLAGFLDEGEQKQLLHLLGRMLSAFAARDAGVLGEWQRPFGGELETL